MMMRVAGGPGLISPIDFGERKKPIPRWMLGAIGVSVVLHIAAGVALYNQRFELSGMTQPAEPDKPIDVFFQTPPKPKPLPPTVTAAPPTPIHKPALTVPIDVPTLALTPPDNPTNTAPPGQVIVSTAPTGVEDGTATVEIYASRIRGGRAIQRTSAKITALHCDWSEYATTGLSIDSSATVAPMIANCIFANSDQAPIVDSSASVTLDSSNCYGNVFVLPAPVGTPDPILPAAGPLVRDPDTLEPFEWSELCGLAQPAGVEWDYYGNPFRARPAIGAVEIPPTF